MKLRLLSLIAVVLSTSAHAASRFHDFVRVQGDQLVEDGRPFRFIGWNIPNLLLVEDNLRFGDATTNGWRLPDRFEMTDALATARQMGGTVVRTYALSVRGPQDESGVPRHVLAPGRLSKDAFRSLDQLLKLANDQGVRLIIPLVDNWPWWGGRADCAAFRGKGKDDFWSDPQLIADFKKTIRAVLTRTNTLTGVRYADDKAILCWETGNELECPHAWTREIAAYIKSLDTNHLVMDGRRGYELHEESLAMPEVDIVTSHHYPHNKHPFARMIRDNAARAKGRKAYVVGEFGFTDTRSMTEALQATVETQTAGALVWSLRARNRDGGFYWHSEPTGGNLYKSFHWPGSPIADAYDETALMTVLRQQAFAIRALPVPEIPVPAPPRLLPIRDVAGISWQGSPGATGYQVERAASKDGRWTVVGENVDECLTQGRPLFDDEAAPAGRCFYRVSAQNAAGRSNPSNVVGPVTVAHVTLVDELADFSRLHARVGELEIESHDCRSALEDAHRAGGQADSALVYQTGSRVLGAKVCAFFPKELADLKFSVSADGVTFRPAAARRDDYPAVAGAYQYWQRASYHLPAAAASDRFVKIEFTGEAQISRVEIQRVPGEP
ncbi:MAG: cellulase family glycosylhydrolase [Verrucomicrobiota bacterium]